MSQLDKQQHQSQNGQSKGMPPCVMSEAEQATTLQMEALVALLHLAGRHDFLLVDHLVKLTGLTKDVMLQQVDKKHVWNGHDILAITADSPLRDDILIMKDDGCFDNNSLFLTETGLLQLVHKQPPQHATDLTIWCIEVLFPQIRHGHGYHKV